MNKIKNIFTTNDYVYDISLDGTFVNALGMNVLHNTDGFNFQMPTTFRYTNENPYTSPCCSVAYDLASAKNGL